MSDLTCELCEAPESVATVGDDWTERACLVCAERAASKGTYVLYDDGTDTLDQDALRHSITKRTEAEHSVRDKLAEPVEAKWERASQPTDTDEKRSHDY